MRNVKELGLRAWQKQRKRRLQQHLATFVALLSMGFLMWLIFGGASKARAHDWYPIECCHQMDCAPIDRIERFEGSLIVTSKHGTAIVPDVLPRRESKDSRSHVCMRPAQDGAMRVICYFEAPAI